MFHDVWLNLWPHALGKARTRIMTNDSNRTRCTPARTPYRPSPSTAAPPGSQPRHSTDWGVYSACSHVRVLRELHWFIFIITHHVQCFNTNYRDSTRTATQGQKRQQPSPMHCSHPNSAAGVERYVARRVLHAHAAQVGCHVMPAGVFLCLFRRILCNRPSAPLGRGAPLLRAQAHMEAQR